MAKGKEKAAEKIHDVAIELLDLYAKREAQPGYQYQVDHSDYAKFASAFPLPKRLINSTQLNKLSKIWNLQGLWIDSFVAMWVLVKLK